MARVYRKISSYLSFKYFSRLSREKYKDQYKKRTGRPSARGWNFSPEYQAFLRSEKNRVITYAKRNPGQFIEKKDTILKRSKADLSQFFTYSETTQTVLQFLNPMKGVWGPTNLFDRMKSRAMALGKNAIIIGRIQADPRLGGQYLFFNRKQSLDIRGEIMKRFGAIANNYIAQGLDSGTEMIGANYSVDTVTTGNDLLAVIDVELFLY
jgi:hypothetical protein